MPTDRPEDAKRREPWKHRRKSWETQKYESNLRGVDYGAGGGVCAGPRIPSLILADLEHLFLYFVWLLLSGLSELMEEM